MYRPKDTQERILHRYKIVQGHLKKVMTMVANQEYCIDILHQSQAVQKALREIDGLMLENHLQGCVAHAMRDGNQEKAIIEVMSVFEKMRS